MKDSGVTDERLLAAIHFLSKRYLSAPSEKESAEYLHIVKIYPENRKGRRSFHGPFLNLPRSRCAVSPELVEAGKPDSHGRDVTGLGIGSGC